MSASKNILDVVLGRYYCGLQFETFRRHSIEISFQLGDILTVNRSIGVKMLDKRFDVFAIDNREHDATETDNLIHESGRLQLNTYQAFVRNLMNPQSDLRSLLLVHGTGTGKTISALATATEYVRQYVSNRDHPGAANVVVLGYTKEVFKAELLKHPEFGFVGEDEVARVRELKEAATTSSFADEQLQTLRRRLIRRTGDRGNAGIYRFYGYGQLGNLVFNAEDIRALSSEYQNTKGEDVNPRQLDKWVREGKVRVNRDFVDGLARSLVICDEVHNLYNKDALNTHGLAVRAVQDHFHSVLPADHPNHGALRMLLLSATPLTTSPLEIAPLLSLLGSEWQDASSLFQTNSGGGVYDDDTASHGAELTAAGAARVRQLLQGKVSYVMDDNPAEYAGVVFEGSRIARVPYLLFERTVPSAHQKSCLRARAESAQASASDHGLRRSDEQGASMIKDIAFPAAATSSAKTNDLRCVVVSGDIPRLASLPPETAVKREGNGLLTSKIFRAPELQKYSSKYARLVQLCAEMRGAAHGKIFIYHPYVQGSGVDLVLSVLRANGFLAPGDRPGTQSLCMKCAKLFGAHAKAAHEFAPVRVTHITGALRPRDTEARLRDFNAQTNLRGEHIKILVGSRAMREGRTLIACRHVIIAHEPASIAEMVQVIGRAVRKNAHAMLPAVERVVHVRVLTTNVSGLGAATEGALGTNEELAYSGKMKAYVQIERIERIMYDVAVDYLINFRLKMRESPPLVGEPRMADVRAIAQYHAELTRTYAEMRDGTPARGLHTNRFNVFYFEGEVRLVVMIIKRILLDYQPVITIGQLGEVVRAPPFHVEYNTHLISDEALAVAVYKLAFRHDHRRLQLQGSAPSLVDALFHESPVLVDATGVEYRIVCVGEYLCADSLLSRQPAAAVALGENNILDPFRRPLTALPTDSVLDLKAISAKQTASIDLSTTVRSLTAAWDAGQGAAQANVLGELDRLSHNEHVLLAEWAIARGAHMATRKVDKDDLLLPDPSVARSVVRFLIDAYYRERKLAFAVEDLGHTRLGKLFQRYAVDTGSTWYSTSVRPSTAKMLVGHVMGSVLRVFNPAQRVWLEFTSIKEEKEQQLAATKHHHPFGFFIYETFESMKIVEKLQYVGDSSRGIQLRSISTSKLQAICKQLGGGSSCLQGGKVGTIDQILERARTKQRGLYPKRVFYSFVEWR